MNSERGNAALELSLAVCVLLVPAMLLVSALPGWLEREAVAGQIAREAARVYVQQFDGPTAQDAGNVIAARIANNHGFADGEFTVLFDGDLRRGGGVITTVRTQVPITLLPGLGRFGGFRIERSHFELVDPYRSQ